METTMSQKTSYISYKFNQNRLKFHVWNKKIDILALF